MNLKVRWWTASKRATVVAVRAGVIEAIKRALNEAGIDIPFPTRVVLFHDQTDEYDGDRSRQREGWPAGEHPPKPLNKVLVEREERDGAEERPQESERATERSRH